MGNETAAASAKALVVSAWKKIKKNSRKKKKAGRNRMKPDSDNNRGG